MERKNYFHLDAPRLEKLLFGAIFFNMLILSVSLIYQLGFSISLFGQFVGIVLLSCFFYNVVIIQINSKVLDKVQDSGKLLNRLNYVYILYAILSWALIGLGSFIGVNANVLSFLYYASWGFALTLHVKELYSLRIGEEGVFKW